MREGVYMCTDSVLDCLGRSVHNVCHDCVWFGVSRGLQAEQLDMEGAFWEPCVSRIPHYCSKSASSLLQTSSRTVYMNMYVVQAFAPLDHLGGACTDSASFPFSVAWLGREA